MLSLFILSQLILLPILGSLFYRIKWERKRKEKLLDEALNNLTVVSIARGNNRRRI